MKVNLGREILDQQLVDRDGVKMGRVDGLVLEIRKDGPPRVVAIEMGFAVLARRVGPWAERWVERLRRFSVRKTARQRVPWEMVTAIEVDRIELDVEAFETPAFAWERWFRDRVVAKIEGPEEMP